VTSSTITCDGGAADQLAAKLTPVAVDATAPCHMGIRHVTRTLAKVGAAVPNALARKRAETVTETRPGAVPARRAGAIHVRVVYRGRLECYWPLAFRSLFQVLRPAAIPVTISDGMSTA
jgi:hypothetical protein